jgi:hypothetical protein
MSDPIAEAKGRAALDRMSMRTRMYYPIAGLIYLDPAGQGSGINNWRWRVSAIGGQAAASGGWEPRDPDGFLRRLRSSRPHVDERCRFTSRKPCADSTLVLLRARCYHRVGRTHCVRSGHKTEPNPGRSAISTAKGARENGRRNCTTLPNLAGPPAPSLHRPTVDETSATPRTD